METIKKRHIIFMLIIAAACAVVYYNSIEAPFVFDDIADLQENPAMTDFRYFEDPSLMRRDAPHLYGTFTRRYAGFLSFYLSAKAGGMDSPRAFRIPNIAIHATSSLLVYALVYSLLATGVCQSRSAWAALSAALFFALHPANTQAVTYIVQRFSSLSTMFYLLSVLLYVRGRLKGRGMLFFALSFGAGLLAVLTKETKITIPVAIFLVEAAFFSRRPIRAMLCALPFALLSIVPVLITLMGDMFTGNALSYLSVNNIPRDQYIDTEYEVALTYLRIILLPVNQHLSYYYPLAKDFFEPRVMASFIVILLLAGTGCGLVFRGRSSASRLVGIGLVWFFMALAVSGGVVVLEPVFEHRMYLPSVGVAMILGAAMSTMTPSRPAGRYALYFIFICFLGVLSVATIERNRIWSDPVLLWEDSVEKSPGSARAHNNLGAVYLERKMYYKAFDEFEASVAIDPDQPETQYNLGRTYMDLGFVQEAVDHMEHAYRLAPKELLVIRGMAEMYSRLEDVPNAIKFLELAVERDPSDVLMNFMLARHYELNKEFMPAIEYYRKTIALEPSHGLARYNLANLYTTAGKFDDALLEFEAAAPNLPDPDTSLVRAGNIYRSKGKYDKARDTYLKALAANPKNLDVMYNLAGVYVFLGQKGKAIEQLERLLSLAPQDEDARKFLARLRSGAGR